MLQTHYKPIESNCEPSELPDGEYAVPGCKFSIKDGLIDHGYLLSKDLDKGVQFIQKHNITTISLNTYYGYELQDTDCLFSLPNVTKLWIHGSWMDKAGLHSLKALRRLDMGGLGDDQNSDVDLSYFPNLQFFSCGYSKKLVLPPELPQMEKMRIWKYPKNDMTSFPVAPKLESLELIQAKLKNLEGIERLASLRYLSIGYCRSLRDMSALKKLNLLALALASVRNMEQLQEVLPFCHSLLGLYIDSPAKTLPSLAFLNEMPNLKCFDGILKDISDGDLMPTLRLDNTWIPQFKKHYNLKNYSLNDNLPWTYWLIQEGMAHWWPPSR